MSDKKMQIDFRQILDCSLDPIFVHDKEFRLLYVNRAYLEYAGRSEQEVLGHPYWKIFPQTSGPLESCICALEKKEPETEEITLSDGRVLLSRGIPVTNKSESYIYSCHLLANITESKRARERIKRLNRLYRTISLGNQALIHASDEVSLAQSMCEVLVDHGGYLAAWVGLKSEDIEGTIRLVTGQGVEMHLLHDFALTWTDIKNSQAPMTSCIRTGQIVRHKNLPEEIPRAFKQNHLDLDILESLSLPLKSDEQVIGALTVSASNHDLLGEEESELLAELASDLAFGIIKHRATTSHIATLKKLELSLDHAVTAIAATVELRDPYTAGHQRRVAKLAIAIATEMGLTSHQIDGLRIAGVVHDIGKIHIPAEILSSPVKLSDAEFDIIKTHCQAGYDILHSIDFPWPIAEIVLQHHEKLDGSGYPQGLKSEAILPEAKVLCVADVIEAMSSHRPYRPGFGVFPALQEISRGKGVLYDPEAVQAALRLFLEKSYEL